MRNIRMLSRVLVGIVFIFSGFVKAVDPLGFTYKFVDYFNAFNLGFLEPLAFPLSILLSCFELVLGIALILGYRMKFSSWVLLVFMSFFTLLTFILALTDPVHDCGCFGDAWILTNWQTFWKNIVIMFFTLIIFIKRDSFPVVRSSGAEWSLLFVFYASAIVLSLYCYRHLPILDFRPYSVGTYIPEAMEIPEGAPESVFETRLYYRNKETGKEIQFTMQDFPKDSLKWEFVDAQTELVKEGYEPPIHDFNIIAPDGSEITDAIIHFKGYTLLLIAYDALEADPKSLYQINHWYHISQSMPDIRFFAVSSTLRDDLDTLRTSLNLEYDFSQADEITLKTIIRSNPGLVLIKNGTIIGKWAYPDFPKPDDFLVFNDINREFPFCTGCDLKMIQEPPPGASPDEYSTSLFYRNLSTGNVEEFTMENFPAGSADWVFENSVSKKTKSGFINPLDAINLKSSYGMEYRDVALFNEAYSLLLFVKDPASLTDDQFRALNKFGALAMEYLPGRVDVYGITSLSTAQIMDFTSTVIPAFDFYTTGVGTMEKIAGDSLRIVLLENGRVLYNYSGEEAPDPELLSEIDERIIPDAETIFQPYILQQFMFKRDKHLVYIYILGFLIIAFLLRLYFIQQKANAK